MTHLRWKHLDPVPAGTLMDAPIAQGDTLAEALYKAQGQVNALAIDMVAADAAVLLAAQTYADGKVIDSIADGDATHAPSRNAVFDALATKQNTLGYTPEDVANKQTDLTPSATKYPTVNAVNTGDAAVLLAAQTYADGKVIDSIADGDATHAPSRNAVFDALALKESLANKGVANGYTPLGVDAKVPTSYLPDAVLGALKFKGTWNATTNIITSADLALNGNPIPAASVGNEGYYMIIATAGSTLVDGISDWKVGDWILSLGTAWSKIDNTDAVSSVNGQTGIVTLNTADVADSLNKRYMTDAQQTVLNNTSGTNTGDTPSASAAIQKGNGSGGFANAAAGVDYQAPLVGDDISTFIHAATDKTTPVGADEFGIWDSVSGLLRRLSLTNLATAIQGLIKGSPSTLYAATDTYANIVALGALPINTRTRATNGGGYDLISDSTNNKIASPLNTKSTLASSSGVVTVDMHDGYGEYDLTLTENITSWSFTVLPVTGEVLEKIINVIQHASAAKTVVSPATVGRTAGGIAWVASTVTGSREALVLRVDSAGIVTLFPTGVMV